MALHAVLAAALTAAAVAAGPCYSPLNPDFETPCSKTIASKAGVVIRSVGAAQLVTLIGTPPIDSGFPYMAAFAYGADMVFHYFGCPGLDRDASEQGGTGCNLNRTAPLTVRRAPGGAGYVVWMAASPTEFPGAGTLPVPTPEDGVSTVALGHQLIAVVNFTTPYFPQEADWDAACAQLNVRGVLPDGFELDTAGAGPLGGTNGTLALYELYEYKGTWVSECWVPALRK
jgi:hypothetical protein